MTRFYWVQWQNILQISALDTLQSSFAFAVLIIFVGAYMKSKFELSTLKEMTDWCGSLLALKQTVFPTWVSCTFYNCFSTPGIYYSHLALKYLHSFWVCHEVVVYHSDISLDLIKWWWIASESSGESCTLKKRDQTHMYLIAVCMCISLPSPAWNRYCSKTCLRPFYWEPYRHVVLMLKEKGLVVLALEKFWLLVLWSSRYLWWVAIG